MANANSTAEPTGDCVCAKTHRALLEQHELAVREWAREMMRLNAPEDGGFVPCPPFPVAPSFRSACANSCVRAEEVSHE